MSRAPAWFRKPVVWIAAVAALAAVAAAVAWPRNAVPEGFADALITCQESVLDEWKHEDIVFIADTGRWARSDSAIGEVRGTLTVTRLAGHPPVAYEYRCRFRDGAVISTELGTEVSLE